MCDAQIFLFPPSFFLCNCFFQFQRSSLVFSVPNSFVPVLCRPCLCFQFFIILVSVFRKSGMSAQICTKLDEFPPKFRLVRHPMTSRTFKTPFRVVRPGHALFPPRCTSGDPKAAHFVPPVIPATPDAHRVAPGSCISRPQIIHFVTPDAHRVTPGSYISWPQIIHFVTPDAHRVTQTSNIS